MKARVVSQTNTDPSAKTGVMLRASTDARSPYYAAYITPGSGVEIQYRDTTGLNAAQSANPAGTPPAYLQVARSGTTFTAYTSTDGTNWVPVAGSTVSLPNLAGTILAGLAVTSHNTAQVGVASIDSVALANTAPPPPNLCPSSWTCADIGFPTPSGDQTLSGGTWTIQAGGGDIWGTSDQFRLISQPQNGDGTVTAHIASQTNTDPWAKSGVMIRQSNSPTAPYYAMFVTPGHGVVAQYRTTEGGSTGQAGTSGTVPTYLRVSRSGTTFSGYVSSDGTSWNQVAGTTALIPALAGTLQAGLAVCSHNPSAADTTIFDAVAIGVPGAPTNLVATPSDASATVTWTPPADNGGSPVTSYTVTSDPGGVTAMTANGSTTSVLVSGLTNGTSYSFTVQATNANGSGPVSATSNTVVPSTTPGAPEGVTANPGDGDATIAWTPASSGGSPITAYAVTASPSGVTVAVPPTATSATLNDLANGTTYTFTVRATNANGQSPSSSVIATPLPAPAGQQVQLGQTSSIDVNANDTVLVSGLGYLPNSKVQIIIASTPQVLGTAHTDSLGAFATTITIPVDLETGAHTLTALGTSLDGSAKALATAVIFGPPPKGAVAPPAAASSRSGYWMLGSNGRVFGFGDAGALGDAHPGRGRRDVRIVPTPTFAGYWVTDDQGQVSTFGDAAFLGSLPAGVLHANEAVTSLSATPSGDGYWLFTTEGRAFRFGDASFFGDMAGRQLNRPVLDSIPTPSGQGYYMVASDGGIFAFGDATFFGSMGGKPLNKPVQSLVPTASGRGYWLVASDGGIFAFGDAPFLGSMGATPLNKPVVGMVRFGDGYLMVASDGGIFNFSDRPFLGSLGSNPPASPIVAVASLSA
jgi:hypothetical protein